MSAIDFIFLLIGFVAGCIFIALLKNPRIEGEIEHKHTIEPPKWENPKDDPDWWKKCDP